MGIIGGWKKNILKRLAKNVVLYYHVLMKFIMLKQKIATTFITNFTPLFN